MIAIDSSSLVAFLVGDDGEDVAAVDGALAAKQAVLPPVVISELFSDPNLPDSLADTILQLPVLALTDGYWERAGRLRARLIARRRKARLADALIAQACLDHSVGLITRDRDFRHFEPLGLMLL